VKRTSPTPAVIVKSCLRGAKLCKSVTRRGTVFSLQPPGVRVERHHALQAIASGRLTPSRDGLFANSNQSWEAAP